MYKNKVNKAIEALEKHLAKLDSITDTSNGNTWKAALIDTFEKYLGSDSALLLRLRNLYFSRKDYNQSGFWQNSRTAELVPVGVSYIFDESKKKGFEDLIKEAISYIKQNGVYSQHNNALGRYSNTQLISGSIFALSLVITSSMFLGGVYKERELIKVEGQLEISKENVELLEGDILKLESQLKQCEEKGTSK